MTEEMSTCAICMEGLRRDLVCGPECGHCFHRSCLATWTDHLRRTKKDRRINFSCPVCKNVSKRKPIALFVTFGGSAAAVAEPSGDDEARRRERVDATILETRARDAEEDLRKKTLENDRLHDELNAAHKTIDERKRDIASLTSDRDAEKTRATRFRSDLIRKTRECVRLYERVETYASQTYANDSNLSELKRTFARGRTTLTSEATENVVRTQHEAVLLLKHRNATLFRDVEALKKRLETTKRELRSIDVNLMSKRPRKRKKAASPIVSIDSVDPPLPVPSSGRPSVPPTLDATKKRRPYSFMAPGRPQRPHETDRDNGTYIKHGFNRLGGRHAVLASLMGNSSTFSSRSLDTSSATRRKAIKKKRTASRDRKKTGRIERFFSRA